MPHKRTFNYIFNYDFRLENIISVFTKTVTVTFNKNFTMKYVLLVVTFFISLTAFTQSDSTSIVQLLKDDYHTMMTHDLEKHKSNCTDDYLLIEKGEIWDMERESEWYKKEASKVYDRKDHFTFKLVNISGNTAYAVYHLQSDFTENGNSTSKYWNESAVFKKINDQWKIALIHSTPIAGKQ